MTTLNPTRRISGHPRFACLTRRILALCGIAFTSASTAIAGCNSGSVGNTHLLSASQCSGDASGSEALAVGTFAFAKGARATVVGSTTGTSDAIEGLTAFGAYAGLLAGAYSTALGGAADSSSAVRAAGALSVAIGGGTQSSHGARADGNASVAIGNRSVATGVGFAVALGFNARATEGLAPTAVGTDSTATGTNASAFGRFSIASAEDATAVGAGTQATGDASTAVGVYGKATGRFSVTLGRNAKATKAQSVAIGSNSVANVNNTVSVGRPGGERRIMNVAPGILATDAVNVAQLQSAVAAAVAATTSPTPTVSVVPAGQRLASRNESDALRRELAELRSLVREQQALLEQQQQRIVRIEGRSTASR